MFRILLFLCCGILTKSYGQQLPYPHAFESATVEKHFNTTVSDPYRWMESPQDTNIVKWLKAQESVTQLEKKTFTGFSGIYSSISKLSKVYYNNIVKKGKYFFAMQVEDSYSKAALYYTTSKDDEDLQLLIKPID